VQTIGTWDNLGDRLNKQFQDKSNNLSLVEQITTIKRAPQEQIIDFNFRFQKTWDRIPAMVRPPAEYAFLYFLKGLNSDISMMIQSLGGNSLPNAYELAIRAENNLIQARKIAPRPPVPIFPEIQASMPLPIPYFAPSPTVAALPRKCQS